MLYWQLDSCAVQPRLPQILHSVDGAHRLILLELSAGETLQEHQVHEHALVLLIEGEIELGDAHETVRLTAGGLAHFLPGERHEVRAISQSRLLLSLTPWPGDGHPGPFDGHST